MTDETEVLARISASPPRRWIGVISLYGMAALLIYVAIAEPPAFVWQAFLFILGGASFWLADRMRRATERVIELTRAELRDSSGALIAEIDNIQSIDRGLFAFKPSNGFLLRTKTPQGARSWQPGLWWRVGKQIGVGGVTPGHQSKFMSEIISAILAEQETGQKK